VFGLYTPVDVRLIQIVIQAKALAAKSATANAVATSAGKGALIGGSKATAATWATAHPTAAAVAQGAAVGGTVGGVGYSIARDSMEARKR
jgi:hypothetical protein